MALLHVASRAVIGSNKFLQCLLLALLSLLPLAAHATPATGYWLNPNASGSGFVIEVQGSKMFMAGFLYAANGEATWVGSVGTMTSSSVYSGSLITFSGGQTLSGAYVPAVEGANSPGNITITFTDDTHANLTWPDGTIPIERFNVVPNGLTTAQPATNPETGWWYNPAELGRGFAIEVQYNATYPSGYMYFAGYMYDNNGNPTWYLAYGPMATGNTILFQGEWTTFANGQTLTGPYVAPIQNNTMAGAVTLQFTNPYTATLTLPDSRQIPLIRFGFGVNPPVLTAFTPAAGAQPEAPLTVNGTGFDPSGVVTLNLSDSTGYSVTIPAAAVTSTSIQVPVPPYIVASNSSFGSGTVNLEAIQTSNGVSLTSNTLAGFNIQSLSKVQGTAGNSTLALIQADLAEAQKLETSLTGTAQNTPAVASALAQQVSNLQGLVTNIQNVVQNGQSYSLGAVGGVDITVTPANIGGVDSLILAALQALANPPAGSELKTVELVATPACLSVEASAFATGITSGASNLAQLAQTLLEASKTSAACNTSSAFTSAYQIFGGAGDVGLGIASGIGGGNVGGKLPTLALFAATTENASTSVGLNALISPTLATQVASVQSAIARVQALADPTTNVLVANSSANSALATILTGVQAITDVVAPPSSSSATISGIVAGTGPIANAAIAATDSTGITASATAAADGSYSVNASGMTAPVFLLATDPAGIDGPAVSVAATLSTSGSTTVNITPLTTAIVALLTNSGYVFGNNANVIGSGATPTAVASAVALLNQALSPILTANGLSVSSNNPITSPLVTNDTGNDAVASALNLLPYSLGLQLVATANPAQTFVLNNAATAPATPLSAPPVASSYLDFMQVELQKCLAVALANRATDPTCGGIVDKAFLANGYTTMETAYPDFALATSVGAVVARPKTLEFFIDTAGYQVALVRFKYTLTDGTLGRIITVMREVPNGTTPVTLPDGTVASWNFYGNQGNYDASVVSRANRDTFLDGADVSYYAFGPAFIFNPSGPNAASVNAVNVTGPGLPGGGLWLFRSSACGTANYMTISGSVHTGPPTGGTQTLITSTTTGYKWSWAPVDKLKIFNPPTNQQWAATQVDATTIPFASIYTFQLYDVSGNPIANFTRRNVSPAVDATYAQVGNWPTLSPAVASAFLLPSGSLSAAQTSVQVGWTNPPLGLPPFEVEAGSGPDTGSTPASVDGFGFVTGTSTSVNITAGVSTSGEITSICTGSQFSAFGAGVYRFIEIQGRDPSDVQVFDLTQYND
jgi:hypothetical protein